MLPIMKPNDYGVPTLYVKEKPFLILGGEIHNSSSSSVSYMEEKVWPALRPLAINTVIAPVYWETCEPEEGSFSFELVDSLILQSRREEKKLILLWFGIWKNGESMYAPAWIKENPALYFRSCYHPADPSDTVSPLCAEAIRADARAFSRLMAHLRDFDQEENTVLMVQVENEIGFLGAERDFSPAARKAYESPVPQAMFDAALQLPQVNSALMPNAVLGNSWYETFGRNAPELFMTWYYAQAIETIASAGKKEYPIPMNVNAWLEQFPEIPGSYPCGGPIAKYMTLWQRLAPSIDLFSPDIYVSDFKGVCDAYAAHNNPLFIPEARRDPVSASNVFYAFGQYNALGFSPFGIEDFFPVTDPQKLPASPIGNDLAILQELNIDLSASNAAGTGPYLQKSYLVLNNMLELLASCRGSGKIHAFIRKNEHDRGIILPLPSCDVKLTYTGGRPDMPGSAGFIIENGSDGFYIAGCNFIVELLAQTGSGRKISITELAEGSFEHGQFCPVRILNGDERMRASIGPMAEILSFRFCLYP